MRTRRVDHGRERSGQCLSDPLSVDPTTTTCNDRLLRAGDDLTKRLCEAATRGVQVQILLPGPFADKRFVQLAAEVNYDGLIESGVELWNFQPSMMHAKTMTVDGQVANVGSANFNARSLHCDEEINMVIFDPSIVRTLDRHCNDDLERSVRIDPRRWQRRSLLQHVKEELVAPLRGVS